MRDSLAHILQTYQPISLAELVDYKLLNRIDTKYICHINQLPEILSAISKDFKVQTSGNERIFGYESLYFDSRELKSYFDHHQGKRLRFKVRIRKYLDTGDVFLEIKRKENFNRTNKTRKVFEFTTDLESKHYQYINKHIAIPSSGLHPVLWTFFDRITLAGINHMERITIDTKLSFKNNLKEVCLPELAIIEVKREKTKEYSPFIKVLHDYHINPYGFSKYIMGHIVLNPLIKHNRFLTKISTIKQICYGNKYDNRTFGGN